MIATTISPSARMLLAIDVAVGLWGLWRGIPSAFHVQVGDHVWSGPVLIWAQYLLLLSLMLVIFAVTAWKCTWARIALSVVVGLLVLQGVRDFLRTLRAISWSKYDGDMDLAQLVSDPIIWLSALLVLLLAVWFSLHVKLLILRRPTQRRT